MYNTTENHGRPPKQGRTRKTAFVSQDEDILALIREIGKLKSQLAQLESDAYFNYISF